MTFAEILSSVYEDCDYAASPAAAVVTRIKRYVNDGMRKVLSEPGMARIQDSDLTFTVTSVASQARYVVPDAVAFIRGISERTNDRVLKMIDMPTYRRRNPDPDSNSGVPYAYVPFGRTAVAVQPSDLSTILVKSSDAGDTTQTAHIQGISSSGGQTGVFAASVALNGTTAATFSARQFSQITDFYVTAVTSGFITLHEDTAGGTELARLISGQLTPRYTGFYLDPTPAAAIDYLVDYRRQTLDLVQTTDEPNLPLDFHPMLAAYARMREYEKTKDDRFGTAAQEWEQWLNRLKYALMESPDSLLVAGRSRPYGVSRLGAWYPADNGRW